MTSPLSADHLRRALEETGALESGHFRLSSGLHSDRYIQCARLLESPRLAGAAGAALADRLTPYEPDSILSPALGGVVIGYATASALGVPFRFVERRHGALRLRRGFRLSAGEKVAVVEDVVTTGGSAREAAEVAAAAEAQVVAFGAIIDRTGGMASFPAPFANLLEVEVGTFEPGGCPLCVLGEPMTAPGSRGT